MKIFVPKEYSGCNLNYQPALIYRELKKHFELTDVVQEADLIVFAGTTACTGDTVKENIEYIKEILAKKKPGAKTYLTGCLTREFTNSKLSFVNEWLKNNIDYIIPQNEPGKLLQSISPEIFNDMEKLNFGETLVCERNGKPYGKIFISSGCQNKCSFCKTTFQKLPLISADFDEIKWAIDKLNNLGIEQVALTGTNISEYGLDLNGTHMLPSLIEYIERKDKINSIILSGFAFKDAIEADFASVIAECSKVKIINGGLESGSDRILQLMRKGFTTEQLCNFLLDIYQKHWVNLDVNIIAGFPTETLKDLKDTVELLTIIRAYYVSIVRYFNSDAVASNGYSQSSEEEINAHARYLKRELKKRNINCEIPYK